MEAKSFGLVSLVTLLFLISNIEHTVASTNATTNSTKTYIAYIKKACNTTTYPILCYKFLSPYSPTVQADPFKLCNISLSLALKATGSASSNIEKLTKGKNLTETEAAILLDCIENVRDSIEELKQSLEAMGHLEGVDKQFQMSNIKTWLSAAITNENTCTNAFEEQYVNDKVKRKITNSITKVTRMTSIALALINHVMY